MSLSTQIKVLGGLPTAGSPPAASSLSADEIAVLLGFADAAAMVAASVQYVLATGGTTNYVAAPALALTPVNGTRIAVRFPSNCAANATLNVSGSGAKAIMLRTLAGERATAADDLLSDGTYIFTYMEDFGGLWISTGGAHLKAADIPSTLNATTISATNAYLILEGGTSQTIAGYYDSGLLLIAGGSAASRAEIKVYAGAHSTKAGDIEYYTGTASGAAHSFFDKNGVERLNIQEDGIRSSSFLRTNTLVSNTGAISIYSGSANESTSIFGGNGILNGAGIAVYGPSHATYPGAHQQFAPLSTRAASTAFAVCPVATGDIAEAKIRTNLINGVIVLVGTAGTVYFKAINVGDTVPTEYVNSSTPAAGEVGIYMSAGVLYCKPGSSWTDKIGSFSQIWKA